VVLRLCASIMSQQLSTKVAAVIFKRFLQLYGEAEPTAEQIVATPPETLRSIGLSNAKVAYVRNVAGFFIDNNLNDGGFEGMDNAQVIALLTQIKGVGKWTVEMLLMFTLGREDVFAVDDLGIRQSMTRHYQLEGLGKKETETAMLDISKRWIPYRTYACFFLWKSKDAAK
jgi:DNA-3-methyladenine glycosylase II